MRVLTLGNNALAISNAPELLEKSYKTEKPDFKKTQWRGRRLSKADKKVKFVYAPYSMSKLLKMLEIDEYHSGCVEAIKESTIMQVETSNAKLNAWIAAAEFPGNEDFGSILGEAVKHRAGCGNAFLLKMRDSGGNWVGLERILPSEIVIVEKYDEFGFMRPDYIQTKNNVRTLHDNRDIIHFRRPTHKSNAWGLACEPIALNIEILGEIKKFDFNNFKSGLLIDYFIIVEGGSLRDGTVVDDEGNVVVTDAFETIQKAFMDAQGNSKSHSSILIEVEKENVKIRLEPLRQHDKDGGFIKLKKDLREGIFAYHRVPARLVSQLVAGQLGGDNNSDMTLFYVFVVSPLQNRIASALAKEFNREFSWGIQAEEFDFGDLTQFFLTADEKIFSTNRNK